LWHDWTDGDADVITRDADAILASSAQHAIHCEHRFSTEKFENEARAAILVDAA
jgi:hypothetical protein